MLEMAEIKAVHLTYLKSNEIKLGPSLIERKNRAQTWV